MLSSVFTITEAQAAAIRAAFKERGELAAAVELRRHFRGIDSNAQARECARMIAVWKPLPLRKKPPQAAKSLRRRKAASGV